MPVSSGLQKYFDSQQKKKSKSDVEKKLEGLKGQVAPEFLQSFEAFHDRIIDIVGENPDSSDMVSEEISELDTKLQNSKRVHDMKKASKIIDISEQA